MNRKRNKPTNGLELQGGVFDQSMKKSSLTSGYQWSKLPLIEGPTLTGSLQPERRQSTELEGGYGFQSPV